MDENLRIDENDRNTLGAVTNDAFELIRNLRVNPITGALVCEADILSSNTQIGSTIPGGHAGSVLFLDIGSTLAEDNLRFFWDATNHRLGLLNNTPQTTLDLGAGHQFQVNSTGDIVKIKNVPYSWPASQGGAGTVLSDDGTGVLSWVPQGSGGTVSGTGTDKHMTRWDGTTDIQDTGILITDDDYINFLSDDVGFYREIGVIGTAVLNNNGTELDIYAGDGLGSGNGGELVLYAGGAGVTGNGGGVFIGANNGGLTSGNGGDTHIAAGNGQTNGNGGDVQLTPGNKGLAGPNLKGHIKLQDPLTGNNIILNTDAIVSTDQTYTLPNQSGTMAVTPDPGADTIYMWDDTDGLPVNAILGTGLSYDHATHTISSSGSGGGHVIQDNGTPLPTEPALNFVSYFTLSDTAGVSTDVDIDINGLTGDSTFISNIETIITNFGTAVEILNNGSSLGNFTKLNFKPGTSASDAGGGQADIISSGGSGGMNAIIGNDTSGGDILLGRTDTITHGLGVIPKIIKLKIYNESSVGSGGRTTSFGTATIDTLTGNVLVQQCQYETAAIQTNGFGQNTNAIGASISNGGASNSVAIIGNITTSTFDIVWSVGNANGTPIYEWEVYIGSGGTDIQTFLVDGTWTKPAGAKLVELQMWGAGGSGGVGGGGNNGGGAGGAYVNLTLDASILGATEAVTIGIGGVGVTGSADGNAGTDTSFGSYSAYGGGGGAGNNEPAGGGGGGNTSAGQSSTTTTGGNGGSMIGGTSGGAAYLTNSTFGGGAGGDNTNTKGGDSVYGGAGGGGGVGGDGGDSYYGGAGGGASTNGTTNGGTSILGGNGGHGGDNIGNTAENGFFPAGGGGAAATAGTSGAGANGQVIAITYF